MTLFKGYKNVYYNLFYENVLFLLFLNIRKKVNMCSFLAKIRTLFKNDKTSFLQHSNNTILLKI